MPRLITRTLVAVAIGSGCLACTTRDVQSVDSTGAATTAAAATTAQLPDAGDDVRQASSTTGAPVPPPVGDTAIEYYTAALLAHVGDSLAHGPTTGHALRARASHQVLQIRRDKSGVPEVHDRWIDVTIVQAGHGTLISGGRVTGSRLESPGEHRGGSIAGGASRPVGPGDLMIVPAGVPHQYVIPAGDSLRYLTVKVLRPEAGH